MMIVLFFGEILFQRQTIANRRQKEQKQRDADSTSKSANKEAR
jgi:hypothetical protein